MFKGLIAVTCLAALAFFGWFGLSEYQRATQTAQIQQDKITSERDALRSQMRDNCARAIDAAEDDDMETALRLSGDANALRRCRQILNRW